MASRRASFERARNFLYENGRVVERRLFATLFENAPADLIRGACSFLESVSAPTGGVPIALASAMNYPRAPHWSEISGEPNVNPTAALAAMLYELQVDHPWRERATGYCFAELERAVPHEAHAIRCVFQLLERVPDREHASALADRVAEALPTAEWFRADPDDRAYGVAPPGFAPDPKSPWRSRFDDSMFEAHLDRLERDQQPDGGWPISWNAPGPAATLEWRGIETLRAIRILDAYGRM